jgi:hypothetical protein
MGSPSRPSDEPPGSRISQNDSRKQRKERLAANGMHTWMGSQQLAAHSWRRSPLAAGSRNGVSLLLLGSLVHPSFTEETEEQQESRVESR